MTARPNAIRLVRRACVAILATEDCLGVEEIAKLLKQHKRTIRADFKALDLPSKPRRRTATAAPPGDPLCEDHA